MYSANYLSRHASASSSPSFQGINHLIRYLDFLPHCPIMYTSGLDVTTICGLRQEVSPVNFHYQKISNGLVAFSDGGEGHSPNDKRYIAWVILCLFLLLFTGQKKNSLCSPIHSLRSLHLLLIHQKYPMTPTQPTKPWIKSLQCSNFHICGKPTYHWYYKGRQSHKQS